MRRLLETKVSVPTGAGQTLNFDITAADAEAMIGKNGSFAPYALRFIESVSGAIKVKKITARAVVHEQGQFTVLKSTNGWGVGDLNAMVSADTDGIDMPRFDVADGYRLTLELDNGDAGAVDLTIGMKVQNAATIPGLTNLGAPIAQAHTALASQLVPGGVKPFALPDKFGTVIGVPGVAGEGF